MDITGLTPEQKQQIEALSLDALNHLEIAISLVDQMGDIDRKNHSSWYQIASQLAQGRGGITSEVKRINGDDFLGQLFSSM